MSNLNPFVPKGSLLEQQSQRRSRLKLAVFCVVAIGTLGLVAMLIQGCTRKTPDDNPLPNVDTNPPPTLVDTNAPVNPPMDTNGPSMTSSNVPAPLPLPAPQPLPATDVPVPATGGTEYVVVAGDTLGKIAKKNHVTLKDLQTANPGVDSKHLKVKQKLTIPAGGSAVAPATSAVSADAGASDETGSATTYTVKSGDNLHKIATKFHVSIKTLQAANHLSTTSIKVGQKLKIPAKTHKAKAVETAPVAPVEPITAPPVSTAPPVTAPAAPAPATTVPNSN